MESRFAKYFRIGILGFCLGPVAASLAEEPHLFLHPIKTDSVSPKLNRMQVEWEIPDGFKVFKDSMKITSGNRAEIQLDLPPGKKQWDPFNQMEREFFSGVFGGNLLFDPSELSSTEVTFQYQACTEEVCFLPQEIHFSLSSDRRNSLQALKSFVGGMAVSLTPCIYPMVPITLAVFAKRAIVHPIFAALIYSVGLSTTYGLLGLLSAQTGTLFGQWLQLPGVILGLCLVFLLLSVSYLSSAGFSFSLIPERWGRRLSQKTDWGPFSLFGLGLVSGLLASPCVTPVLLGLLVLVAEQQNHLAGFISLWSFGFGISVPLMVLAIGTRWGLTRLPSSGPWLEWSKRVISFVLLLVIAWIAKPLEQKMYLGLLTFAFLFWIFALAKLIYGRTMRFSFGGALTLMVILVPFFLIFGQWIKPKPETRALCDTVESCSNVLTPGRWYSQKRDFGDTFPIPPQPGFWFVDLKADWCFACKELEAEVLTQARFLGLVERTGLFLLERDLTQISESDKAFMSQWNVRGLPHLILFEVSESGEAKKVQEWTGLIPESDLIESLQQVLPIR